MALYPIRSSTPANNSPLAGPPFRSIRLRRLYPLLVALWFLFSQSPSGHAQDAKPADEKTVGSTQNTGGSIQGKVIYETNPQRPWRLGRYYIRNAKSGELAEAVVGIAKRDLKQVDLQRAPMTVEMDQKDFQFVPETLAIRVGDSIKFLNSDNHAHNVKSSKDDHAFNVNMPAGSQHVEKFAKSTGVTQPYMIDCVFHSAMRAWVFVFDHPWFQVTGADGSFKLENIPPGEYRLEVSHPAGDLRARQSVQVTSGTTTQVEIRIKAK